MQAEGQIESKDDKDEMMLGSISFLVDLNRGERMARRTVFIAKREQASRTPNASRMMTSRSMSQPQCLKEQPNLAAAFGVREACFRFGVSGASVAL